MNDPHEVRLKLLDRPPPRAGVRPILKGGYEPRQFLDIRSAVAFARTEAAKISRQALFEVVEERNGQGEAKD